MKRLCLFLILACGTMFTNAQSFSKVELHSIGQVFITQGDSNAIEVNTAGSKDEISTKISGDKLVIESEADADYHITMKKIDGLSVSGTGEIVANNAIRTDRLELEVSGSGKMTIPLQVRELDIEISGVGKMTLSGSAESADIEISGSGKVEAMDLTVKNCKADISGVGKCNIDVTESLETKVSGLGSVNYKTKPKNLTEEVSGMSGGGVHRHAEETNDSKSDTTRIKLGDTNVLIISSDSAAAKRKEKSERSRPIWSGVELGFNNLLNEDGEMAMPAGFDYLELNSGKSVSVALNFLKKDFRFGRSNLWFFTGLGLAWNNYRFDKNVKLSSDLPLISGSRDTAAARVYTKSKLVVTWLQAPLMFEIFTSKKIKKAFHIGAGGVVAYKIGSHSKVKYSEDGTTAKPKVYDDFFLSPFRYGARVDVGYGKFNLFAEYYPSTLFKDKKGPSLYPVNIGLTLAAF